MAGKKIRLRVLTPTQVLFSDEANFIILRSSEGDMGILHGHEPCSALLDYGMLRIFADDKETDVIMVLGGFVTVLNNDVTVLSDMAERPDKLQATIDKIAAERAANKLREHSADLDVHRAEMVLRRSLVHMDVSSYSIIRGYGEQE